MWASKCLQSSATEKLCDYSQGFVGEWRVGGIGVFLKKGVSNSQQAILSDKNSGGKEKKLLGRIKVEDYIFAFNHQSHLHI